MHERFTYAVESGRLGQHIAEEASLIFKQLKSKRNTEVTFGCILFQAFINLGYFVHLDFLKIILNIDCDSFSIVLNTELNNLRVRHNDIFTNIPIGNFHMHGKIYFVAKNLSPKIQKQVLNFLTSIYRDILKKTAHKKKKKTSLRHFLLEKKMYKKRVIFFRETSKNMFLAMAYACVQVVSPIFSDFDIAELLNIFCVKERDLLKLIISLNEFKK